jgi:hypothetical protein
MKNKIILWLATSILLISINILVLYILSGFFIILHTEKGMTEILDKYIKADFISAIAALASFGATYMAYRAAEKAAIAAENANIISLQPCRMQTHSALSKIYNFLNYKACVLGLDKKHQDAFLITDNELEAIKEYHYSIMTNSHAYGSIFSGKLVNFSTFLQSELSGQRMLHDTINDEQTLTQEHQKQYLEYRESKRDEAFQLLEEASRLLHATINE